jgi:hypothetical protein
LGIFRSRFGIILAALYLTVAAVVTYHVYRCTRQGFLPCDLPLGLVILPAFPCCYYSITLAFASHLSLAQDRMSWT